MAGTPSRIDRVYVVGMGEVGRRLAAALSAAGAEVRPVTRDTGWDEALSDPLGVRLLAVREEALHELLERLEGVPQEQLAAVQNGWIRPLLAARPGVTRGLVWFTSKGEFFTVLRPSPFHGPLAGALSRALAAGGIDARAVDDGEFRRLDADKMGFNCVVGLPLAVHGLSLAEYLERLADEAEALFDESVTVCARALGSEPDPAGWPAFLASAEALGWVRVARAKALELRNGAIARLGRELAIATPVTDRLLEDHAALD